jgi:hypothetical protein
MHFLASLSQILGSPVSFVQDDFEHDSILEAYHKFVNVRLISVGNRKVLPLQHAIQVDERMIIGG